MKDLMNNIQKWFKFSMNYESKWYKWTSMFSVPHTDYLPVFLMECKWHCGLDPIIGKWLSIEESDSYGRINRFYADLDNKNREILIEWFNQNYSD